MLLEVGGVESMGSGQTLSWHSGGQQSRIFSKRYFLLSSENPGGGIIAPFCLDSMWDPSELCLQVYGFVCIFTDFTLPVRLYGIYYKFTDFCGSILLAVVTRTI